MLAAAGDKSWQIYQKERLILKQSLLRMTLKLLGYGVCYSSIILQVVSGSKWDDSTPVFEKDHINDLGDKVNEIAKKPVFDTARKPDAIEFSFPKGTIKEFREKAKKLIEKSSSIDR